MKIKNKTKKDLKIIIYNKEGEYVEILRVYKDEEERIYNNKDNNVMVIENA